MSGISKRIANNIIEFRAKNGLFSSRKQIKKVAGLGEKAFEQCAGFLRIPNSENPLDNSAVHPEHYHIVENIAEKISADIRDVIGKSIILDSIKPEHFADENAGIFTIRDIIEELKKPGRDPRETFTNPEFRDDITTISDLKEGMILEGVVTNITKFGAFVDIGVHQDGLLHISEISHKYIADIHKVLKAGMRIKVEVKKIDIPLKRITLTAKIKKENNMVLQQ